MAAYTTSRTSKCGLWTPSWHAAAAAAAAMSCGGGLVIADMGGGALEAETGVSYAGWNGGRALAGTGCRLMGGIVRVYTVGLYVSPVKARDALQAYIGRGADDLLEDDAFWTDVCTRTEPVLRLVVVREVNGTHMASGFERGLTKAMGKRSAAQKRFAALFKRLGVMKVGSEMIIRCENSLVELIVDGRPIGAVHDSALVRSLTAMYVGERAVTPSLKADVANGFAEILTDVRM